MPDIIPNLHPIFVHFSVALLSLAVVLSIVLPFIKSSPLKDQWEIVARWALWFGAGFGIITGLTGLYAYNTVAHDTPSHLAMTDHRNWAIITIVSFLALAIWSFIWERKNKILVPPFLICIATAGLVLAATAWHGGEAVYRYGIGVMSLPNVEEGADGHNHSHNTAANAGSGSQQVSDHVPTQHDDDTHSDGKVQLIEPSAVENGNHMDDSTDNHHATTTVTEEVGEKAHTNDHDHAH